MRPRVSTTSTSSPPCVSLPGIRLLPPHRNDYLGVVHARSDLYHLRRECGWAPLASLRRNAGPASTCSRRLRTPWCCLVRHALGSNVAALRREDRCSRAVRAARCQPIAANSSAIPVKNSRSSMNRVPSSARHDESLSRCLRYWKQTELSTTSPPPALTRSRVRARSWTTSRPSRKFVATRESDFQQMEGK